jgi:hypothetical protein
MKIVSFGFMVCALTLGSTSQGDDIVTKAINTPSINYDVQGVAQTNRIVRDVKVVGGRAVRIEVKAKGPENYSTQASAQIVKPVVKGHRIAVAVWARAPRVKSGETFSIPFFGLVGGAPSWTPIATGKADIGPEWKLYDVTGTATADYPLTGAGVTIHLGASAGTIELGPVFVIDLDART